MNRTPENSGETLREQTPFLPEELYELLPPLIREAVSFYPQRRERDMALLGACTVLSACLLEVRASITASASTPTSSRSKRPAANGKGCHNDMRHLADHYANLVEVETGRAEEEYRQALEDWELKKAEARKNHRTVSVKDAPIPVQRPT